MELLLLLIWLLGPHDKDLEELRVGVGGGGRRRNDDQRARSGVGQAGIGSKKGWKKEQILLRFVN